MGISWYEEVRRIQVPPARDRRVSAEESRNAARESKPAQPTGRRTPVPSRTATTATPDIVLVGFVINFNFSACSGVACSNI